MITVDKIDVYRKYRGYYDGYYIQNKANGDMISGDDWFIITSLIQDLYLVKKGLAAESFRESLNNRLAMECDNGEVMEELSALAAFIHGI